jgi:hypothetical protein
MSTRCDEDGESAVHRTLAGKKTSEGAIANNTSPEQLKEALAE